MRLKVLSENDKSPTFFSTVTPGKLPTFCFKPVSALNNEDLPLLGFPVNTIFFLLLFKAYKLANVSQEQFE